MSSTRTKNSASRYAIMVLAYGSEPVKLWAVADLGKAVEVFGRNPAKPIGYPAEEVYQLDEQLFEKLRVAYRP